MSNAEHIHSLKSAVGPLERDCEMARRLGWTEAEIDDVCRMIGLVSRSVSAQAEARLKEAHE